MAIRFTFNTFFVQEPPETSTTKPYVNRIIPLNRKEDKLI